MRKPPPMRRTLEKPLLSTDNFGMTSTDNRSPFYCKSPRRLRLDGESFGSEAPESRGKKKAAPDGAAFLRMAIPITDGRWTP